MRIYSPDAPLHGYEVVEKNLPLPWAPQGKISAGVVIDLPVQGRGKFVGGVKTPGFLTFSFEKLTLTSTLDTYLHRKKSLIRKIFASR